MLGRLTLPEAAAFADRSAKAVRTAIWARRLPAPPASGRWRVVPTDLKRSQHAEPPALGGKGTIDPDGLYRIDEAASVLGLSRQAVYQVVECGAVREVETDEGRCVRGPT